MNFPKIEPLEARIAPATISIAGGSVTEGDSGTTQVFFTVSLDGGETAAEQVTVHFATADGTAVSTGPFADFLAQTDTLVTFDVGDSSKQVAVDVKGDPYAEGNETFTAKLSNPSGTNTISTATATGTINNDDQAAVITLAPAADVTEGNGVTSKFTVNLSHAVETNATVNFATGIAADTAKPAPGAFTDYLAKTGTVTFTAGGALTQEISVAITNDTFKEDPEQFTVTLASPMGATLGTASAIGKILNDGDTAVGLHLGDVTHVEGNADNTLTLTATLSAKLATDLDFTLSTQNGTAVAGSDFTGVTLAPVKIVAGQISKTFAITVKGDTNYEATESFFVNLNGATGVTVVNDHPIGAGAQGTARVYLYNDDIQVLGTNKLRWSDVDGDIVTLSVSKGSFFDSTGAILNGLATFADAGSVGGVILQQLDLATYRTSFAGASVSITATKPPGFPEASDGRVDVGLIQAATFNTSELQVVGLDLGNVTIDGDLAQIRAGDQFSTPAITRLDVYSLGVNPASLAGGSSATLTQSDILGPIGSVNVKTDVAGFLHIVGAEFGTIGTLKIGGTLQGGTLENSGRISASGRIGTTTIGAIEGGAGAFSGFLSGTEFTRGSLGNVTIHGDVTGGSGANSGRIEGLRVGNVSARSIIGGTGDQSGLVLARSTLGSVTLSGDLTGGTKASSGEIFSITTIGAIKIAGKITGAAGDDSGSIQSGGNITSLSVGAVSGGAGKGSGSVRVAVNNAGAVSGSGSIGAVAITAQPTTGDALLGGTGLNSGRIDIAGNVLSFTSIGNVHGGTGDGSGAINARGNIGKVVITGSLIGANSATVNLNTSGAIKAGWLKSVAITGDILAGKRTGAGTITSSGAILADRIDLLTVGGKLTGDATNSVFITATGLAGDLAIKSLAIVGAVDFAEIRAGYDGVTAKSADASIGTVVFGGTVHGLNLIASAAAGADARFGTADDVLVSGTVVKNDPLVISRIASVLFQNAQAILPNVAAYGIAAQNVAAITLGAAKIPLQAGPGNDRTPIELGGTSKFRVVELALS